MKDTHESQKVFLDKQMSTFAEVSGGVSSLLQNEHNNVNTLRKERYR